MEDEVQFLIRMKRLIEMGVSRYHLNTEIDSKLRNISINSHKIQHSFQNDPTTSSATKCICGHEKHEHIN